jgi:HEAT repeat protein
MNARLLGALAWLGIWSGASAQSLATRVAQAADGEARIAFSARAGVFGNGRNVIQWDCDRGRCRSQWGGDYTDDADWHSPCDSGPVRVSLAVRGGRVASVHVVVGGQWLPKPGVTDLGRVPAPEAAKFLLGLARQSRGDVGDRAVFAATLADSTTTWPELLRMARDESVPEGTRRTAVFWVSQAAEAAASKGLDSLVGEDTINREVREQAVFALSQRPREEGVPILIRIARTHHDPEIRRRAIFWLGQSQDPRALALFEDLLTKP